MLNFNKNYKTNEKRKTQIVGNLGGIPRNSVYHYEEEGKRARDRLDGYTADNPRPQSVVSPVPIPETNQQLPNNSIYHYGVESKRASDRLDGYTAENPRPTPSNTVFNYDVETQRAIDRMDGYTAENPRPQSTAAHVSSNNYQTVVPTIVYPNTGYRYLDQAEAIQQVGRLKDAYQEGQIAFHSSDIANSFREQANQIRSEYGLSDAEYGSGVTSQDVYARWQLINELGTIKSEYETNYAADPEYANSEEAAAKRNRAAEIRSYLGLSDAEYGSDVTGADVLKKAEGIKSLYEAKSGYENYWHNSQEAKKIMDTADLIRKIYGLSDAEYGSGVTAQDVDANLSQLLRSAEYQRDMAYKNYNDTNQKINEAIQKELSDEVKMRAILDRVSAQKIAEDLIGEQLDKEIRDSLKYEDELAAQRGSYGQLSYGKRRAIKEERKNDSKAERILSLVNSLISEDSEKASAEYQQAVDHKNNRLSVLNQQLALNQEKFNMGQQYRGEIAEEEALLRQEEIERQKIEYERLKERYQEAVEISKSLGYVTAELSSLTGIEAGTPTLEYEKLMLDMAKAEYDRAFETSNALGYVTAELSALTGIEAGTSTLAMLEYYGDLQKFYDELEQEALIKAEELAIAQYNAETERIYATRPYYVSYSGGGYSGGSSGRSSSGSSSSGSSSSGSSSSGSSSSGRSSSGSSSSGGNLSSYDANAMWERYSSQYSEKYGKAPSDTDAIRFAENSGFGVEDQKTLLYAAGLTDTGIVNGVEAVVNEELDAYVKSQSFNRAMFPYANAGSK